MYPLLGYFLGTFNVFFVFIPQKSTVGQMYGSSSCGDGGMVANILL